MKKFLCLILIALILLGGIANKAHISKQLHASDAYIRDRVVMLRGDLGGCSGIEIAGPSGMHYILTARHCQKISSSGIIDAKLESGTIVKVRILDISKDSDLMLLSPADLKIIAVSEKVSLYEHIHTLTHGGLRPTYRTDGEMLMAEVLSFPLSEIMTEGDAEKCLSIPNQRVEGSIFGALCVIDLKLNITTAMVIGGSSGGPVLNEAGELVGIVSGTTTTGFFSTMVTLEDIHRFLADK